MLRQRISSFERNRASGIVIRFTPLFAFAETR
jgi:hypothetical protein